MWTDTVSEGGTFIKITLSISFLFIFDSASLRVSPLETTRRLSGDKATHFSSYGFRSLPRLGFFKFTLGMPQYYKTTGGCQEKALFCQEHQKSPILQRYFNFQICRNTNYDYRSLSCKSLSSEICTHGSFCPTHTCFFGAKPRGSSNTPTGIKILPLPCDSWIYV